MSQEKTIQLIGELEKAGIYLWEEDGKLRYRAPQGVMSPAYMQQLKDNKTAIMAVLEDEKETIQVVEDKEGRFEPFPLTDIQAAYLLGRSDAFAYGGIACHIYIELTYDDLEIEGVRAAWNKLIARHEMLRAVINKSGYQQILPEVPELEISYKDLRDVSDEQMKEVCDQIREEMGHRIYDTEKWPLFGVAVTRGKNRSVLHFSIEFLIADWTSIWMMVSEFENYYFNLGHELPKLQLSFRDYITAERKWREKRKYYEDQTYWKDRLDTLPLAPELPMARDQQKFSKVRFGRHYLQMKPALWESFKQQCTKQGVTPTAAVMTAYAAVLERWSKNKQFCLNLTVLNRFPLHEQVGSIVGDFTSVNLLAVDWADRPFAQQGKAINSQLFEDLDHRLFTGVEVLREIASHRGREAALMPIVFTSSIGLIHMEGEGMIGRVESQGISQTPQVFIDCQAMDGNFGLQVNWDVRQGVFPDGMIDDMFAAFEELLNQLAVSEEAWNRKDNVQLPAWQQKERDEAADTAKELPKHLLHSKILQWAKETPDKIAVTDPTIQLSYKELVARASAVAKALKAAGCQPQDRVAVLIDKSAQQIVAALGALLVNAVYVPIDASQAELRRQAILEKTGTQIVLTSKEQNLVLPENITNIQVDALALEENPQVEEIGTLNSLAYIIHTSGSTGTPKGVAIAHGAAVNTIEDINQRYHVTAEDKTFGLSQLTFDLSVYDVFGILNAGGTLVMPDAAQYKNPSHWAKLMSEQKVTLWNSVPALMQMLTAYLKSEPELQLPSLRLALLSGDWIPLNLPDQMMERIPSLKVVSLGGATEASIWSISHEYDGLRPEWTSIPYGKPLSNQGYRALDCSMQDCPVFMEGELYITGDGLMAGYYNNPEVTAERLVKHPADGQLMYRTGDMGRYMPGGEIEFLGRQDNQVKVKGHRIELGEIEAAIQKHPDIEASAVIAKRIGTENRLFGFAEGNGVTEDELKAFMKAYVPAYMIPQTIELVDKIPLTSNGKVDRKALADMANTAVAESASWEGSEEMSDLEKKIALLWCELLKLPSIGKKQDLYELGADSLTMAQTAGKLREMFIPQVSFDSVLVQILNDPTVEGIAGFIEEKMNQGAEKSAAVQQSEEEGTSNAVMHQYGEDSDTITVVLHDASGTLEKLQPLIDRLSSMPGRKVTAFEVKDVKQYCEMPYENVVELLAEDYVHALKAEETEKFALIGYGFGGWLALEMASRLTELGAEISSLSLIDSRAVREGGALPENYNEVLQHSFQSMEAVPNLYMGDLRLYTAQKEAEFLQDKAETVDYWEDICLGEFENIDIPGTHETCVAEDTLISAICEEDAR